MGKAKGKGDGGPAKGGSNKSRCLAPMHLSFNPNEPVSERPVVALTTAVLCNVAPDLTLVSDHRRKLSGLGVSGGGEIVGDLCLARYLARSSIISGSTEWLLGGSELSQVALVDQWVDYASSMSRMPREQKMRGIAATLEKHLGGGNGRTFVCSDDRLTLADLALFGALGWPAQHREIATLVESLGTISNSTATTQQLSRWLETIASHPAVREGTQLAVGISGKEDAVFDDKERSPLVSGMNSLDGATPGRVCTRFPPEPSGYLHIGHAKAALLNDYYARHYEGRLIVRFDDTNPSKEKEEYQESIMEDLRQRLRIDSGASYTFTSDYFPVIYDMTVNHLISTGLAYMDDTPQEQMQKERMERTPSKYRDSQSPQHTRALFDDMCSGSEAGSQWCLRVKMDMSSDNGTLRDPVVYRQNNTPHHRTGTTYHAYPTYDLACPIVDSLEGVTHALRTTEYNDRDAQYAWIQRLLGLRRVRIHAFARMNFTYTVLSKRKLAWFVENGQVTGWDDARFPTIRGVIRRGVHIDALKTFIFSQGASKRVVNMEWNKFWADNKKEIDKTAKRFMAIDNTQHVFLTVDNFDSSSQQDYIMAEYHPKDPSLGQRKVRLGSQIILEKVDTEGIEVDEEIVLMRWGVVKIHQVTPTLVGSFVPNGDVKKAKRKLSWLTKDDDHNTPCILTEFDNLLSKPKLDPEDVFEDHLNPNTLATSEVIGDNELKTLNEHDIIQLERRGYYRVDRPYKSKDEPLILFMIPDGKAKAMSGLVGKLAHR